MPHSNPEGRDWVVEHYRKTTAKVVIDVGCGAGTYSDLLRGWRKGVTWIGVDIFEPYVERYDLHRKYDAVDIRDLRDIAFPDRPFILLAGDVLEHMPREDSVAFLARARTAADEIMVSVPIIDYPQGELEGNIHECHRDQWTFEQMELQLPGCETWRGEVVGRYWWKHPRNSG